MRLLSDMLLLVEREKTTVKPRVSDHQKFEELEIVIGRWSLARIIMKQGKINDCIVLQSHKVPEG